MTASPITIGVLSLQGDFAKHQQSLETLGIHSRLVRAPAELAGIDGLVIPGGESTVIGKLMHSFGIAPVLEGMIRDGFPVFGTCAGMIMLARRIKDRDQYSLGALSVEVERNSYGRQVESFEADIPVSFVPDRPVRGVFIRAPRILACDPGVEVLGTFEDSPVLVREGNLLAASFHPELTGETAVHAYFAEMVSARIGAPSAGRTVNP